MNQPKSLEEFWEVNQRYADQLKVLRETILTCGLSETFKWAFPTYTLKGKNLIAIGAFKDHFAIWFFQGVFLLDSANVLNNAQEGKTKAMRHWKFDSNQKLDLDLIRAYIYEAIDNHKAGKAITVKVDTSYQMPELLEKELRNKQLDNAFYDLLKGKQKEFATYISEAKQEKTRLNRLTKIIPLILEGKGLNDKYR